MNRIATLGEELLDASSLTRRKSSVRMEKTVRQRKIARFVATHQECTIEQLANKLGVSEMTIRRDLQALAEDGKVIRTHGGATHAERVSFEFEYLKRSEECSNEKNTIAKFVAGRIKEGQSILLDAGTTTLAVAEELRNEKRLTIITTSLPAAARLQFSPGIEVLLLGGYLRESTPDLSGAVTESNLEFLRADIAILGTQAVDEKGFHYQQTPELASLVKKMADSSKETLIVADSSKLGKSALCRAGRIQDCSGFVTDSKADKRFVQKLEKLGAQVHVAGKR